MQNIVEYLIQIINFRRGSTPVHTCLRVTKYHKVRPNRNVTRHHCRGLRDQKRFEKEKKNVGFSKNTKKKKLEQNDIEDWRKFTGRSTKRIISESKRRRPFFWTHCSFTYTGRDVINQSRPGLGGWSSTNYMLQRGYRVLYRVRGVVRKLFLDERTKYARNNVVTRKFVHDQPPPGFRGGMWRVRGAQYNILLGETSRNLPTKPPPPGLGARIYIYTCARRLVHRTEFLIFASPLCRLLHRLNPNRGGVHTRSISIIAAGQTTLLSFLFFFFLILISPLRRRHPENSRTRFRPYTHARARIYIYIKYIIYYILT